VPKKFLRLWLETLNQQLPIYELYLLTQTLCMLHAAILFCMDDDENDAVSSYATAVLRMDQE